MTERNDNSSDDALTRRYREAGTETPPPAVDRAILAAARAAATADADARKRSRWPAPVAVAAVVLLSVTLVMRVNETPGSLDEAATPVPASAPAPEARGDADAAAEPANAAFGASAEEAERRAADRVTRSKATEPDAAAVAPHASGARREQAVAEDAASAGQGDLAQQSVLQDAQPLARLPARGPLFDAPTLEALAAIVAAWNGGDTDAAHKRLQRLREARPDLTDADLATVLPPDLLAPE